MRIQLYRPLAATKRPRRSQRHRPRRHLVKRTESALMALIGMIVGVELIGGPGVLLWALVYGLDPIAAPWIAVGVISLTSGLGGWVGYIFLPQLIRARIDVRPPVAVDFLIPSPGRRNFWVSQLKRRV